MRGHGRCLVTQWVAQPLDRRFMMMSTTCVVRRVRRRVTAAQLAISSGIVLTTLSLAAAARAERYYVVYEEPEPQSRLNLGFDLEGAVPTVSQRFASGNDLTG